MTHRSSTWLLLLLALPACDASVCANEPLSPPITPVAWAVRFHDVPDFTPPPMDPGEERLTDPPGTQTYAAYSLYDVDAAVAAERWLDTLTRWEGATATITAADRFASVSEAGRLTLLLADGRRPRVSFSISDGSVGVQADAFPSPPEIAGQLVDSILVDSRAALVTRRRTPDGGGDALLIDPQEGLVIRSFDLSRGMGPVEPGRIAALEGARYLIGLTVVDEPNRGVIALVDLETEAVSWLDVPSLGDCWEVAAMAADPAEPSAGRAAVFCRGDQGAPAEARPGLGFATVRALADDVPEVSLARVGDPTSVRYAPTHRLVPLDGDWIAVGSRGDAAIGRDDALVAYDLTGEGTELLWQERPNDRWGDAIGEGDFGGGELWWPSVTAGILRWRMEGTGASASFSELTSPDLPECEGTPPRDIRYLRAP